MRIHGICEANQQHGAPSSENNAELHEENTACLYFWGAGGRLRIYIGIHRPLD